VTDAVQITLTVAREVNMLSADVTAAQLERLLVSSLNRHAGGVRMLNGRRSEVSWALRWVDRSFVQAGTALGVSLVPDAVLHAADADGVFARSIVGTGEVCRILLAGGHARQALSRNRRQAAAGRTAFGNASAHEFGHSQGAPHQDGTLMHDTNTSRLDRYMTDAQLLAVLRRHLPEL
jgi:hypothetical protein